MAVLLSRGCQLGKQLSQSACIRMILQKVVWIIGKGFYAVFMKKFHLGNDFCSVYFLPPPPVNRL